MSILASGISPRAQIRDEAAVYIRELIVSGQVLPGELLRLTPLADRIGASVTPVREALLLLMRDGWVRQEPNVGFRVEQITREDVEDAYLVQAYVSGELAARSAANIDDQALRILRRLDREMSARRTDPDGSVEAKNYELHRVIFQAADSNRLVWFADAASRFVPRRFWGMIDGWLDHNREGHKPIIDALEAHDPAGARQAMSEHIAGAGALLVDHLNRSGYWSTSDSSS